MTIICNTCAKMSKENDLSKQEIDIKVFKDLAELHFKYKNNPLYKKELKKIKESNKKSDKRNKKKD